VLDEVEHAQRIAGGQDAVAAALADAARAIRDCAEAFVEAEEHHRCMVELNPQMPWSADAQGNVLETNRRWSALTGLSLEDTLGAQWLKAVHPDDIPQILRRVEASTATGDPYDVRFRVRTAAGEYRWMRSRASPARAEDGTILRWYGATEDVHEQVLAEQEMQQVAERFRLAALATNDVIWDWDLTTDMVEWNSAIGQFGDPAVCGMAAWWADNMHPEDRSRILPHIEAFINEGSERRWSGEYRFRRLDGSYSQMFDRGYLLRGADGSAIRMIGAMTDLSDRHEAEARVKHLQSELIHVSRISAMGAMAATLAHELNQPLAAANNWLGVARALSEKMPDSPPRLGEALAETRGSIVRAGEIIRRIRGMLSRGSPKREAHDLRRLVEESLGLALLGARASGVETRVAVHDISVKVDRIQIQQVILNLVRNAIEAMSEQPRRELFVGSDVRDGVAELIVSDTGPGFAPELREQLFTAFMTTKDSGLGVGLSISRTIIEAHGGTIRAAENPGGGTTFRFTLPRA
jgi:PAS domain S-box-containing protein